MDEIEVTLRRTLSGRYAVGAEIGRGGMAVVFRAEDIKHGRPVAIKAFRPPFADPVATSRFLQEIRVVATLGHPHILPLHDSGEAEGVLYFVTPFVEGETLRRRIEREGPLSEKEAVRLGAALARALDHAHRRGVVHRDVKPENVLLQEGEPLLADFGIAFPFQSGGPTGARITGGSVRVGTPAYMSPEQVAGEGVDGRSDLYSLGVVLFEMLCGRGPFEGRTPTALLSAQVSEAPPPIRELRAEVSPHLAAVVERALAKDPAARWPRGEAMADALERPPARGASAKLVWGAAASLLLLAGAVAYRGAWPAPAGPPRSILLAELDGQGVDRELTRYMRELIAVALTESRLVTPLAPDQVVAVRRAAGIDDTVRIVGGTARQLAARAGVGAMVTGEILRAGGGYSLILHALRVSDGADLVSVSERTEDAQGLVQATERAARRLRAGLGEKQRDLAASRPLLDVATPSFPAFQKYVDALERSRVGDPVGSNVLLREAIVIDTGFGAAWALMAVNFLDARQLDSAAIAVGEALVRPARLSDAQRYRLQADAAYALSADPAAAIRWYDLYLQEVPHSSGGRNNRALYLTMLGRWAEARTEFLQAAEEDPRGASAAPVMQLNALACLVAMGQLGEAEREAAALAGPFRQYAVLLIAAAADRWEAGAAVADSVLADPNAPPWLRMQAVVTRASGSSAAGRLEEAERLLSGGQREAKGATARWYGQARLLLGLASGRRIPDLAGDTAPGGLVLAGTSAGWRGDAASARRALASLEALDSLRQRRLESGIVMVRAAVAMAEGRPAAAADLLTPYAQAGELDGFALDRPSGPLLRWAAARARLAASDSAAATRLLGPLRISTSLPPNQVALRGLSTPYIPTFVPAPH